MADGPGGLPVRIVDGAGVGNDVTHPIFTAGAAPGGASASEGAGTSTQPFISTGLLKTATATITRPADTNAYAALDAVSNSTSAPVPATFANLIRVASYDGYITKMRLTSSVSTQVQRMRAHLFRATVTAYNDNAPHTVLYANVTNRIAVIDFPALKTEGTGSDCAYAYVQDLRVAVSSATTDVFALLETLDAFTPASAQTFHLAATIDQN